MHPHCTSPSRRLSRTSRYAPSLYTTLQEVPKDHKVSTLFVLHPSGVPQGSQGKHPLCTSPFRSPSRTSRYAPPLYITLQKALKDLKVCTLIVHHSPGGPQGPQGEHPHCTSPFRSPSRTTRYAPPLYITLQEALKDHMVSTPIVHHPPGGPQEHQGMHPHCTSPSRRPSRTSR